MKKLLIPLMAGLMALGTLSLAHPAGAATVTTPKSAPSGMTSLVTGQTVNQAVKQAKASYSAQTVGAASVVCCGWGTVLLELSHSDVGSIIVKGWLAGQAALDAYLCGFLPGWVTTGACIFAVAFLASVIDSDLSAAWNNVTYQACPTEAWCGPGAFPSLFGWLLPVHVSGLNILFTWVGIPIAEQINPYARP